MAPVAFWTGILTDDNIKNVILNEISQWTKNDRIKLNIAAHTLDSSQEGPANRSFSHYIDWISKISIEGLKNRNLGEEVYFESFIKTINEKGPYTLQLQKKTIQHLI